MKKRHYFTDLLASVSHDSKAGLLLGCALAFALSGCSSRVGDLGRPESNSFTEGLMLGTGRLKAKMTGELVSDFNFTDEETTMRDVAWNLIRPPHAQDWMSDDLWRVFQSFQNTGLHLLTETQAARLTPLIDMGFDPKRYYWVLRSDKYASHHVRYERIIEDTRQDREALAAFVPVAERVVAMDRERMAALERKADLDPREMKNAYARVDENKRYIAWVWRSLQYRMTAYAYAIKKLEVETPSPLVKDANDALQMLLRDFQEQNGDIASSNAGTMANTPLPSRYTRRQWDEVDRTLIK
ncbi:hypothetical protein [uncultured Cohaesibacter sp.]|uniref:hypothetical protein n=1 Tax=uncultured Cohaesibacter sp. TaxID=1002546 RepID=UPI0029C7DA15|nr:hypothetical protein [uncultured Cohaesibacter sp.]